MTLTDYRQLLAGTVTEKEFLRDVTRLATLRNWLVYHTHRSDHSAAGFPDLCMVRDGRMVLAELKTERGRLSEAQKRWLGAISQVTGVECHLWRPSDFDTIIDVLR